MIRQLGDYVLTAHAANLGAMFFSEVLVSKCGDLTLHRHQFPTAGFATYAQAVAHAQEQLVRCRVLSDGSLLTCHTGAEDALVIRVRDGLGRTL